MLELGIKHTVTTVCREEDTAKTVGSGDLRVFSTPSLLAQMELCAAKSVAPHLEEGQSTVGIFASLKHLAATPVGMEIRCESELVAIDKRKLTFVIKAYDAVDLIGECEHERFIITSEKFLEKCYSKQGK